MDKGGVKEEDLSKYEIPVKIKKPKREKKEKMTIPVFDGDGDVGKEHSTPKEYKEKIESMKKEIQEKEDRITQLEEQVKRLSAEFENFRRRQEKRYEDAVQSATERIIEEFFPVLDSINRAISMTKGSGSVETFLKGLEMVKSQLDNALKKIGVEEIEAVGKPLDPRYHNVVAMEETEEHPTDTVTEEIAKGYMYKGRVIRPSMVKVAKKPQRESKKES